MKNLSPIKKNTGNMPASLYISTTGQSGPNQGQIKTKSNLGGGLICCDSDLARSFQVLKGHTVVMGHPDNYIQKSLCNVTTTSRSQSLPCCLEIKKSLGVNSISPDQDSSPVLNLTSPERNLESKQCSLPGKLGLGHNESWFKTWPERGNERLLTPKNNSDLPPQQDHPNHVDTESDCDIAHHNTSLTSSCMEKVSNSNKTTIPLSELLDSFPIAYSPLTRQLHIINRSEPQDSAGKCHSAKENELTKDVLRPLESIEEDVDENAESPKSTLQRTDASSFSSIVSSLSDISPSATVEDLQVSRGRDNLSSVDTQEFFEDAGAKPKRKGFSGFFTRWRSEPRQQHGQAEAVAGSSALILHGRPPSLPAKSHDEELRHRTEYERMVAAARKKELKEAKCRKKQLQQQLKFEEQLAAAARVWIHEILPKWDQMRGSRNTRELWWRGLPPSVRGKVWRLAIGNRLGVTARLYEACAARARERLEATAYAHAHAHAREDEEAGVELIQLDIARTFPHLCIFQKGGPYYDMLHQVLGAYACYRPHVGYVQGMSFIAAVLILNVEATDAFVCLANLLDQPCHTAFFTLDQPSMQAYYAAYDELFRENLPQLHGHFAAASLTPDLYLLDWIYTVFAKAMPLDVASRVWDVFLRDGDEFLFRAALGVLHLKQEALLQLDFLCGAQFLTRLPDDLSADRLFQSIACIRMAVGKKAYCEVLAPHLPRA